MPKQTAIDSRLNRLIGQIEGIRRMIHAKRPPGDITQQIMAARQALSKVGAHVFKDGILNTPTSQVKKIERMIETVFKV